MSFFSNFNLLSKSRLESYVMMHCLWATLLSVGVISSLIFLIDFVDISKSLGAKAELSSFMILGLMLLRSPNTILVLLPFAFLSGSLIAFVRLNRSSELIAMRAAGVSAWRFVLPASALSFVIGLFTIFIINPVSSYMGDNYERIHMAIESSDVLPDSAIYLRQGDDGQNGNRTQVVIRATTRATKAGQLKNATFWIYSISPDETPHFIKRIDAQKAELKNGYWQLTNAYEAQAGEPALHYDVTTINSNLDAKKAFKKVVTAHSTPFWELPNTIKQSEASGFSAVDYRLKLNQLLATPLMFAAMSALGAVFSLRLMRLGGIAKLIASGVGLGFVIFFINQLLSSMGKAEVIPVTLAGWVPAILAMLIAMSLLVYTEDG